MKYSIAIDGMHCAGCAGLIAMSLEEAGLLHPAVSLQESAASFDSDEAPESVQLLLDRIFEELAGYSYKDLAQK
jgi:copper chaperone CopZ